MCSVGIQFPRSRRVLCFHRIKCRSGNLRVHPGCRRGNQGLVVVADADPFGVRSPRTIRPGRPDIVPMIATIVRIDLGLLEQLTRGPLLEVSISSFFQVRRELSARALSNRCPFHPRRLLFHARDRVWGQVAEIGRGNTYCSMGLEVTTGHPGAIVGHCGARK
jgi:hypothetical protein